MSLMDISLIAIVSAVLGVTMGATGAYLALKKVVNRDFLLDLFDDLTSELLQDENSQKKLYAVGILLGNGIKNGVGLSPKGGKMKFEDLLMGGFAQLLQNGGLGGLFGGGGEGQPPNTATPQKKQDNLIGVLG